MNERRCVNPNRQKGMALIMAVLAVTLATITAVAMASRQQVDIRRTLNVLNIEQAQLYAQGGEYFADLVLTRDYNDNPATDKLSDVWNNPGSFPLEGGNITGTIIDRQACFNINNLVYGTNPQLAQQRFRSLLTVLGLVPEFADAIIDWLDTDFDVTLPEGAEDVEYLAYTPPYRAANRPMQHVSELLLVKGIDLDTYDLLRQHVCVLPEPTAININTATAMVLRSLDNNLTDADAEQLVAQQQDDGFDNLNDFAAHAVFGNRTLDTTGLSVNSNYFLLTTIADFGAVRQAGETLLHRDTNGRVRTRLRRAVEH